MGEETQNTGSCEDEERGVEGQAGLIELSVPSAKQLALCNA